MSSVTYVYLFDVLTSGFAALMEYHTTQDKEVATRIFEAGMASHSKQKEFVLRYLTFLISVNDENSEY